MVDKHKVYHCFRHSGLLTRLYLRVKLRICPLFQVESYVPERGAIVDLGCGNGLFAAILTVGSTSRRVTGYDLDTGKIRTAEELKGANAWTHLAFHAADIVTLEYPPADVITLVDVLYLVPYADQVTILKKCAAALRPGGTLVVKEMDTRPLWKYAWNLIQETLAVKVIGFTLGSRFYFRSREGFERLIGSTGFQVQTVRLDRCQLHPHILYIGYKT